MFADAEDGDEDPNGDPAGHKEDGLVPSDTDANDTSEKTRLLGAPMAPLAAQIRAAIDDVCYGIPNTALYALGVEAILTNIVLWATSQEELDEFQSNLIYVAIAVTYLPLLLKTLQRYFAPSLAYISGRHDEAHWFQFLRCPRFSLALFPVASLDKTLGVSSSIYSAVSGFDNSLTTKIIGATTAIILFPTNAYTQAATFAQSDNARFCNTRLIIFDPKFGAIIYAGSNTILTVLPPVKFFMLLAALPLWARTLFSIALAIPGLMGMLEPFFNESYKWNLQFTGQTDNVNTANKNRARFAGAYKTFISQFFTLLSFLRSKTTDPLITALVGVLLNLFIAYRGYTTQAALFSGDSNPHFNKHALLRRTSSPLHTSSAPSSPTSLPAITGENGHSDISNGNNSTPPSFQPPRKGLSCIIL